MVPLLLLPLILATGSCSNIDVVQKKGSATSLSCQLPQNTSWTSCVFQYLNSSQVSWDWWTAGHVTTSSPLIGAG